MGVSNDIFMKVAACGTWCGDFFTAWMVTSILILLNTPGALHFTKGKLYLWPNSCKLATLKVFLIPYLSGYKTGFLSL